MSPTPTSLRLASPQPVSEPPRQTSSADGVGPMRRLLQHFRTPLIWVLVFSAFANILLLAPTIYMLQLFDRVMSSGNAFTLLAMTVLLVLFVAALSFAEWVRSQLLIRAGNRLDDALGGPVFQAAFRNQLRHPQRSPQQPLADIATLRQFGTGNGIFSFADTPWSLLFVAVLFLMHPWFGWLALVLAAGQLILALVSRRLVSRLQQASTEATRQSTELMVTQLRAVETLTAMGMLPALARQWRGAEATADVARERLQEMTSRIQVFTKWLQYTQQAVMLALGAWLAIRGEVTVGAMIASNALIANAVRPLGVMAGVWGQATEAVAAWRRLDRLLGQEAAGGDGSPALQAGTKRPQGPLKGQVSLSQVTVKVPGRNSPILDAIEAEFNAGELVGIVGPSGAGKSTLVRCMLGIWPGAQGEVRIDGVPLSGWDRQILGEQIGYLPQDVELFEGTIAQNIARFADLPDEAVVEAAKSAGIHDMVLAMPRGYDTLVGPAGVTLSGGQRQRVALARALVTGPRLLVLDEPNANLDDAGDAALAKALVELKRKGVTIFMIVHRQQLLSLADRLLILERGRISSLVSLAHKPAADAAQPS